MSRSGSFQGGHARRLAGCLALGTLLSLLAGCGWQLRGFSHNTVPDTLYLSSATRMDAFSVAVRDAMRQRAIDQSKQAPWQLALGQEQLDQRVVAVTRIGSPSQYELTLSVSFRYTPNRPADADADAGDDEAARVYLTKTLTASRVYDFDPASTVAKSEEEAMLLAEMRRELAHRVLESAPDDA